MARISPEILFEIEIKSCLALYRSSSLIFLIFHGLRECTLWVQWCHSLLYADSDPSAVFCTHTKVFCHLLLYLGPESQELFYFLDAWSHSYHRLIALSLAECSQHTTQHMHFQCLCKKLTLNLISFKFY